MKVVVIYTRVQRFIQSHPLVIYFSTAYFLSFGGFLLFTALRLVQGRQLQSVDALILFPIMVVGVGMAGIVFTRIVDGKQALQAFFSRLSRWKVGWWYTVLLLPPCLIILILSILHTVISSAFALKFFPLGITFGLVAGFFEELGWTGYVYPRLHQRYTAVTASILLGILWGIWHAPVVDYLGAATPHGAYWLPFFLSFIALITALRVLLVWVYTNTKSILLVQLLHASNTGFLVVLSPARLTPEQETFWYALYAMVLWGVVAFVVNRTSKQLTKKSNKSFIG